MPLVVITGSEAVANRKNNPFATWGDRNSPNRVEPVAKPTFAVPFKLEPGERIFTVGSCFARNVETELLRRGFQIPMRDLFRRPEFQKLELGIINNFGTPSIYNEFAWALGERPFVPEDHILPMSEGKFADLHMIPTMRPDAWDVVLARRTAVVEAMRTVKDCRVLIMTLGLVEIWFDTKTGYYLNSAPRPTFMKNEPDRFQLHVLSFEEAHKFLDDALRLVRKHGRPDLQVLLTVSPVPMMVTQRPEDVLVANTYSKSVLRAVAETIVAQHDFVTYYPSYESVVLSDRRFAWADDFVHVTDDIVALNVGRMVDAFVGAELDREAVKAQVTAGGAALAIEKAQAIRAGSHEEAAWFFGEFAGLGRTSNDFAAEHASFLLATNEPARALEVVAAAPDPSAEKLVLLETTALTDLDRPRDAMQRLEPLVAQGTKSNAVWNALMRAAMATREPDTVVSVLARWRHAAPGRAVKGLTMVGKWFHERGEVDKGLSYLQTAIAMNGEDFMARASAADALLALGRRDEARQILLGTEPKTPTEVKHGERLRALLA